MDITFLEAAVPLCKTFSDAGSSAYPLVKNFTSHSYCISANEDGLKEKYNLICEHASKGHALYKGNFSEDLRNESRKNKTLSQEKTQSLIMDVDGMPFHGTLQSPMSKRDLAMVTEQFVSALPAAFHKVSYITQASASMGTKGNKLNLHVEFFLDKAVSPRMLKTLLVELNFQCSMAKSAIDLSAAGTSLVYPIDVCLADNSRIIYIAPPAFEEGRTDPFKSHEDRHELVLKSEPAIDIMGLIETYDLDQTAQTVQKYVKQLRKIQGKPNKQPKLTRIKNQGDTVTIIANPDQVELELVADEGQFIRFNRVGGDSNAYYVDKACPAVLRNFKGEEPVFLPEASAETYDWVIANFPVQASDGSAPFCFRDMRTDIIFTSFYDPKSQAIVQALTKTSLTNVKDFFADFGMAAPEIMPQMTKKYDPTTKSGVHFDDRIVNEFFISELMAKAESTKDDLPKNLEREFGTAYSDLHAYCPTICDVISHVSGSDTEAFERFINWLAFIVQNKDKAKTSWVFHGVQGTGKGVMFENIIQPILGIQNSSRKTIQNLEDDKNEWISNKLFVMLDEFSYKNAKNWNKTNDLLKETITDKRVTVRKMFTDQFDTDCWVNYIICSNHLDPIKIETGDRRFNVCPRQEVKLVEAFPDIKKRIAEELPNELLFFTQYLTIYSVNFDMVTTCWENLPKARMRETALSSAELMCRAIKEGDLEFFIPALEQEATTSAEFDTKPIVHKTIKNWIKLAGEGTVNIAIGDIQHVFNYQNRMNLSSHKAKQMLAHNGIHAARARASGSGKIGQCVKVAWQLSSMKKEDLITTYVNTSGTNNPIPFLEAQE